MMARIQHFVFLTAAKQPKMKNHVAYRATLYRTGDMAVLAKHQLLIIDVLERVTEGGTLLE